jgi:hypothetical protein
MKIKVYRLLAQPEIPSIRRFGGNTWENPTQVTIVSTSITDVHHVDRESAVIVSNGCRYKISREDFDKIFEVEVL